MVIGEIEPDLLVVQEVENEMGYTRFLEDVLNHTGENWEGASFKDQPDTDIDIALYFKSGKYEVVSTGAVNTTSSWGHRDAVEFVVRHLPSGQGLRLYGVHLKAGNSDSDAADRQSEASKLRAYLNDLDAGSHFLVMGDFLVTSGDLHLGMICYYRSLQLNHPNPVMVKRRIDNIRVHWGKASLRFKQWQRNARLGLQTQLNQKHNPRSICNSPKCRTSGT